jgi:hypothetical protein
MTRNELLQLLAEQKELRLMLSHIPASAVLDRMGMEARLKEIEAEVGTEPKLGPEPARAQVTFRGKPVVKSHGIFAEFGTEVMKSLTEVVTAMAASHATGPLKPKGPIPNREEHQLLITNTVPGSFGFEVEEYQDELPLEGDESSVAVALAKTQAILEKTRESDDDDLAEVLSETDSRTLNAVRNFLKVMVDAEASCGLEYRERMVRFSDPGDVQRSMQRLGEQNVKETNVEIVGRVLGAMPVHRTFEFEVEADKRVITGKVGPAIEDADILNAVLKQRVKIKVVETRVGSGRPRYVLSEQPEKLQ